MPDSNKFVVVLVTAPDGETAETIGRKLLEERLVACVNVVPGLRSFYWWRGRIEESDETLMLLKARREDVRSIVTRVRELHPYEVPEVLATDVVDGLGPYLDWIQAETDRSGN